MKLRERPFELEYDTNFDADVLNGFYIPALSSATRYRRMTGYFTSSALSAAARGITAFIENDGVMQILTSPNLSESDVEIMNMLEVDSAREEYLAEVLSEEINEQSIRESGVEALGWMLAKGHLEIRIVLIKDDNGNIVSDNIFHNKIGIIQDEEDTVVFSGSINETATGWMGNIESFDVFCSWTGDEKRMRGKIENFNALWEIGEAGRSITVRLPEAVKNKWVSYVPQERKQLQIFASEDKRIVLRNYQKDAIESWASSGYRGIFNMATGTGKTMTAVHGLKKLMEEAERGLMTVIVVPFQHLIDDPWLKTIESEIGREGHEVEIVKAFGGFSRWEKKARSAIHHLRARVIRNLIILTTYDTFHGKKFIEIVSPVRSKKLIIADEVHYSGSSSYRNGLLEEYDYRLGLSATPARYLDEEGTAHVQDYFVGEVYSFDLGRAITEINPDTGETYLAPYYYHPLYISLNDQEIEEYRKYTKRIAGFGDPTKLDPREQKVRTMILIQRARILKNAAGKVEHLESIIPQFQEEGRLDRCLVYCSDGKDHDEDDERTITRVVSSMNRIGILSSRFTSDESHNERHRILSDFEDGTIDALIAIKCLDEGVDIPATKNAIIMASTGNPREYIQRRGRVLRRYPGKTHATIYDFVVIPRDGLDGYTGNSDDLDLEVQILISELQRFKEFSDHSLNREENEERIKQLMELYSIEWGGIFDE